jgi:hypothetical protein
MDTKQLHAFLVKNQDKDRNWLAKATNLSNRSINDHQRRLREEGKLPPATGQGVKKEVVAIDPEKQFQLDMEKLRLNHQEKGTDKKYKIAMGEIMRLRDDLEAVTECKNAVSTYSIPKTPGTGGNAVAVVLASDWHVEENVKPESVNGSNEYNLAIAKKRAEKFFQHTLQLVQKEQQAVKIETLVLALLGDFFSGNIHDELLASCEVGPQDAMLFAQNLIASGIEFLLKNSKLKLVVPCCVGNHSRMTHKILISQEQAFSLEWAMYSFLAQHFAGNKRVTFVLSRSYHNYLDILGYKVRFHHGHAVQYGGGIGGLTIPMIKAVQRWDNDQKAYLSCCGHFHQKMDGERFIVNGSLIGDAPYGKRLGFTGRPEQVFFLIDQKRGKTVVCPVLVE